MKNKQVALLILLLAHLLTILDIFIVNVAIPSIQHALKAGNGKIQLVVAMYMVGFASFLIIGGKAGDYYGRKRIFILGLLLFMLTSLGCAFAGSSEELIAMRFFQGMSAGLMSPQVLSYIQVLFMDHKQRTIAMGWYGIAIGIGTMLGQFLGGFLVEVKAYFLEQSWRYIFLINIPVCLICIWSAVKYMDESRDKTSIEMDFKSAGILCTALVLLIFSLSIGLEYQYVLEVFLPLSILLLLIFVFRQRQRKMIQKEPLLNMELFRNKNFNKAVFAVGLFMFMLDAYFFILAVFLQDAISLSPIEAGYFIVFQGLGFILCSLFSARLVLRFGKAVLILGVLFIAFALLFQLILFYNRRIDFVGYAIMMIHGVGVALVLPSFANIALKSLPENLIGNASGVYSTLQQLFGALGIAITGGVFFSFSKEVETFEEYYIAFFYGSVIHLICLIGVLFILVFLPNSVLPSSSVINKK